MSKPRSARQQGESIGGCLHVLVYLLLIHPLRWLWSRLRGKPTPSIPRYIARLTEDD